MYAYVSIDDVMTRSISILLFAGSVLTIYFAGQMAQRRGRSFRNWAWAGALFGPLAFPLLFLLPNLHRGDPQGPEGEQRPADATCTVKSAVQDNPDPSRLNMSFSFR
jgi:hypothetical protein